MNEKRKICLADEIPDAALDVVCGKFAKIESIIERGHTPSMMGAIYTLEVHAFGTMEEIEEHEKAIQQNRLELKRITSAQALLMDAIAQNPWEPHRSWKEEYAKEGNEK